MLELLRQLVEIESPTADTAELRDRMAVELEALGAAVTLEGEHVRAELAGEGPPLLLLGHIDTVWPRGTLATMSWRVERGCAFGPGSCDMKGGLVVLLEAIRRARTERALRVVLTADEEIGSPTARELLAHAAEGAAAAFVCEPPTASGDLKTARKGLGRFSLHVTGRAAHAGEPQDGVSAIEELARLTLRLHALNERARGVSINVGVVAGGSDGNLVAALGVPVLDGLGAAGGGAHAPDEHVLIESLDVRAELLARILRSPGV